MRKGISLIVLVITIIVIIILAGAVILNLSQNNPIDSARIAKLVQSKESLESSLQLYLTSKMTNTMGEYSASDIITGKVSGIDALVTNEGLTINNRSLFVADGTKVKENLGIDLPKTSNESKIKWYIEVSTGKFYLIYDTVNEYESWLGIYNSETEVLENATLASFVMTKTISEEIEIPVSEEVVEINGVAYNRPDISKLSESTTKAVKWDASNVENELTLTQASTDTSWYDYSNKKWANIYTNNNNNKAYWVWIPRYAYKIDNPHTATAEQIHIMFLSGTSDTLTTSGESLPSGYIVHPAFRFGDKELTGIWVAKYEASSDNPNKVESGVGYTGGGNDISLQVRVLPDVYSWRNISAGNAQTASMNMTNLQGSVGTNVNLDVHQMKNIEWGAVAYLSQSEYGEEPWINPYGDFISGSNKLKTGYAGASKDSNQLEEGNINLYVYNTTNGVKASTTGNIYGIYDMSGGGWERTATLLDNGNSNIGTYGKAEHIQNNKIKEEYSKYYDIYEPGDEEKEGGAYYGAAGTTLWNSGNAESQNIIRKRLTDATYAKFSNKKGDALWETSNVNSYYGMYTSGTTYYDLLMDTVRDSSYGPQYATGWNFDLMLIGNSNYTWIDRGGSSGNAAGSGIFYTGANDGTPHIGVTFRPVLISGLGI